MLCLSCLSLMIWSVDGNDLASHSRNSLTLNANRYNLSGSDVRDVGSSGSSSGGGKDHHPQLL